MAIFSAVMCRRGDAPVRRGSPRRRRRLRTLAVIRSICSAEIICHLDRPQTAASPPESIGAREEVACGLRPMFAASASRASISACSPAFPYTVTYRRPASSWIARHPGRRSAVEDIWGFMNDSTSHGTSPFTTGHGRHGRGWGAALPSVDAPPGHQVAATTSYDAVSRSMTVTFAFSCEFRSMGELVAGRDGHWEDIHDLGAAAQSVSTSMPYRATRYPALQCRTPCSAATGRQEPAPCG